ncbi:MAG TPA: OmpH family outer membrane protein [Flavobacteriales bacterium]|nr:OmpH family outer membrane protein [Flavobacteriales bacterium]HMR28616.1 OmpH family outer membrane protein [Flavobacteriales bacterium]
MENRSRMLIATGLLLLVANLALTLGTVLTRPRIAFVRSQELVYGYMGMKDAMSAFQERERSVQANIDTMTRDLERQLTVLRHPGASPTAVDLKAVKQQQQELVNYRGQMTDELARQEEVLLAPVLEQVNTFVERYAKEHGYDVVLGTTASGNLLHGDPAMDVTEDVLTALNNSYEGR